MSRPRADYYKCSRSSASARLYCMVVSQCEALPRRVYYSQLHSSSQESRSDVPRSCVQKLRSLRSLAECARSAIWAHDPAELLRASSSRRLRRNKCHEHGRFERGSLQRSEVAALWLPLSAALQPEPVEVGATATVGADQSSTEQQQPHAGPTERLFDPSWRQQQKDEPRARLHGDAALPADVTELWLVRSALAQPALTF
jgi:hypothetical protein